MPSATPKAVAIVQARMGSSRLPGKVLRPLGGRPVVEQVLRRVELASSLRRVVLATGDGPGDDVLASWAEAHGYGLFRGSESDPLQRFADCARALDLDPTDVIVRVTADCPLVDPELIDFAVERLRGSGLDAVVIGDEARLAIGVSADFFTAGCLWRMEAEAQPGNQREHVVGLLIEDPARFATLRVPLPAWLRYLERCPVPGMARLRLTLDTAEDLALLQTLFARCGNEAELFEIFALLAAEPELSAVNARVPHNFYRPDGQLLAIPSTRSLEAQA